MLESYQRNNKYTHPLLLVLRIKGDEVCKAFIDRALVKELLKLGLSGDIKRRELHMINQQPESRHAK
jgi:hypothetical protein